MRNDNSGGSSADSRRKTASLVGRVTRRDFLASGAAGTTSLLFGASGVLTASRRLAPIAGAKTTMNPDWTKLQGMIKGEVVPASKADFSAVRSSMVWNELKPDRSPEVIVRCKDANDVVE